MVTIRNVTMLTGVYNASEQLAAINLQAIKSAEKSRILRNPVPPDHQQFQSGGFVTA
jgi:hypothetical protein